MRTVGPSPATIAFAAAVFSPILSRRSSRTFTPAAFAVAHIASASVALGHLLALQEERQEQDREERREQAAERHRGGPRRERPQVARGALDEDEPAGDGDAEHGADGEPLGPVGEPPARRLAREAVAAREPVARDRERQVEQRQADPRARRCSPYVPSEPAAAVMATSATRPTALEA